MIDTMNHAPWLSPLANHLWQSTILAAAAWLLTFALRNNQARIRYWIWLVASLKFLLPFSLLIAVGQRVASTLSRPVARPALSTAIEQIAQPFQLGSTSVNTAPVIVADNTNLIPFVLLSLWAVGSLALALSWLRKWWHLRAAVRMASQRTLAADVPVLSSSSLLEPGIFGIVRPVLLLPDGITNRLTQAQLEAILAHEMCHVRRRDNLTFALHMTVETIFWFHPLVWWIRTRLIEERERACDEAVLQSGNEAEAYAEGILNVCKFYVESPLACVSGVTGSDLKQRIVRIMTERLGDRLSLNRKLLLGAIAVAAIALPVVMGVVRVTEVFAQTKVQDAPPDLPTFEVSTIKPNKSGGGGMQFIFTDNGLSFRNILVQTMLREAFNVNDDRIVGAPGWVKTDHFDVEAKVSGADAPKLDSMKIDERRMMLQPLLAERFNLKYHHETRELPVYSLVIAKGGLKLKPTTVPEGEKRSGVRMNGPGDFEGTNDKVEFIGHVLSEQPELGHTIIDKTGLTGSYDFHLQWTPLQAAPAGPDNSAGAPAPDTNKPGLLTALQ